MNAERMLKQISAELQNDAAYQARRNRPQSVLYYANCWQSGMYFRTGVDVELTPKEYGQIKLVLARLRGAGISEPDIEAMLSDIVAQWDEIANFIAAKRKLSSVPPHPDIGFLLYFINVLIENRV